MAVSARKKLERSILRIDQREAMADISLHDFNLVLRSKLGLKAVEAITGARISRSIEGSSQLTVQLEDQDREILQSGLLSQRTDVQVDGLWFRLVSVQKDGSSLSLIFEDREISVLRTYTRKIGPTARNQLTRAEFILRMIREVKEFKIRTMIPQLHVVQPVEKDQVNIAPTATDSDDQTAADANRAYGFADNTGETYKQDAKKLPVGKKAPEGGRPDDRATGPRSVPDPAPVRPDDRAAGPRSTWTADKTLTIKGDRATKEQLDVATKILDVGVSMHVPRKLLVVAMMVAIDESVMRNPTGGDADSVGAFQQRASWGSYTERHDVKTAARMFFNAAIKQHNLEPGVPFWTLAADVQRPREDLRTKYDLYFTEAVRLVTAYGIPGNFDAANNQAASTGTKGGDYQFYRGVPPVQGKTGWKKEDSWTCIQRLAEEVGWRAFFVSGTFYYMSERQLLASRPRMSLDESSRGVDWIDFDYDQRKKSANVTVKCHAKRWVAPPGSVVQIRNMGPVNGRWIVTEFERDLYSDDATITLKKPRGVLPEPLSNQVQGATGGTGTKIATPIVTKHVGKYVAPFPVGVKWGPDIILATPENHHSRGLGDWQSDDAWDLTAEPGTPVLAVESGTLGKVNLNHQGEHGGNIFGAQVSLIGDSGVSWFYTHIDGVTLPAGSKVRAGQLLGYVTVWFVNKASTHLHLGTTDTAVLATIIGTGKQVKGGHST